MHIEDPWEVQCPNWEDPHVSDPNYFLPDVKKAFKLDKCNLLISCVFDESSKLYMKMVGMEIKKVDL